MVKITDEQWNTLVPIIERIDGGCSTCIQNFLVRMKYKFDLTLDQLKMVDACDDIMIARIVEELKYET